MLNKVMVQTFKKKKGGDTQNLQGCFSKSGYNSCHPFNSQNLYYEECLPC